MTGVDKDLAILREVLTLAKHTPFGVPEFHLKSLCRLDFLCLHAPASLDRVEALLREQHAENAGLREERDAALRMIWRIATRGVGADTTPEEALATIATYVENKQRALRARRVQP